MTLSVPLWLDSHLVAMCDQSSRANDGLPEASSIRPSLTGLPVREAEREMTIDMLVHYLCVFIYMSQSPLYIIVSYFGCVCAQPWHIAMNVFSGICVHVNSH